MHHRSRYQAFQCSLIAVQCIPVIQLLLQEEMVLRNILREEKMVPLIRICDEQNE
jgi:hypothetical protein